MTRDSLKRKARGFKPSGAAAKPAKKTPAPSKPKAAPKAKETLPPPPPPPVEGDDNTGE